MPGCVNHTICEDDPPSTAHNGVLRSSHDPLIEYRNGDTITYSCSDATYQLYSHQDDTWKGPAIIDICYWANQWGYDEQFVSNLTCLSMLL